VSLCGVHPRQEEWWFTATNGLAPGQNHLQQCLARGECRLASRTLEGDRLDAVKGGHQE
jgi:hypothetical protein